MSLLYKIAWKQQMAIPTPKHAPWCLTNKLLEKKDGSGKCAVAKLRSMRPCCPCCLHIKKTNIVEIVADSELTRTTWAASSSACHATRWIIAG